MIPDWSTYAGLLIAVLGGAAVGLERQRSGHATGPGARFAGVRTFTLLGACAGVAGWLWQQGSEILAAVLLASAGALVVAAYAAASRNDVEATTEVAALVVLAAGTLAGLGQLIFSSAIISITVLLLVEKSRLHEIAKLPDEVGFRAGVRFGVMALVVLPLLPEGPFGPWGGVRPRELWLLVLFFSGLSFFGYLLRQAMSPRLGYPMAGMAGGLVSSTNVTIVFARTSREEKEAAVPLALGVVASCTVLFLRVLLATTVLNRELALALLPYFAVPFLAGALFTYVGIGRAKSTSAPPATSPRNPLQFWSALQMTVLFQVVLYAVHFVKAHFGSASLLTLGAVLGLTDMDALTISMAKSSSGEGMKIAAQAIVVGVISNTALKSAVALAFGDARFRMVTLLGLLAIGATLAVSMALW